MLAELDVLFLCTGNTCRSPMAAALFAACLAGAPGAPLSQARVRSAGLLFDGRPATDHGVKVMSRRGLDISGHRSTKVTAGLLQEADLVVTMAREHVLEAVGACPDVWPRIFTLKELVRRGEQAGPRATDQSLSEWLAPLHEGRRLAAYLGTDERDDVADPIGRSKRAYARTAAELEELTQRLAVLLGQRSLERRAPGKM